MTQENLTRLNGLLSKQITNLEANVLLSWSDKVHLAEIIMNLSESIMALTYAAKAEEGERWRE